jgi:molybdopterin molybdotransferase
MLSVSEARTRILSAIHPVPTESVRLASAAGRVLASDLLAPNDLPLFDNSSVDGFALTAGDAGTPRTLQVVADIRAGDAPLLTLQPGQAARIMTGAALPTGAVAVVMVEDTDFNDRKPGSPAPANVTPERPIRPGENVRHRGDDLHTGDCVLEARTRLRAQEIGLLAMLGQDAVQVHRRPRLGLLSSGDELQAPGEPLTPGKIRDANTYTLAALAETAGVEIVQLGIAADNAEDVRQRLQRAVEARLDCLLSSAGVSVGAFDFIKSVVEEDGELDFWQINMRPGKPLAFGEYAGMPFFGLPGNPVSAFVGFEVFVRPALEKMSGLDAEKPGLQKARLAETVESDGRESYLRAIVERRDGQLVARLTGHQGSGNIFSLVRANALLIVPSGVKSLPATSEVEIWLID